MNKTEFLHIIWELRTKIHSSLKEEHADVEAAIAIAVQKQGRLDKATRIALLELLEEENLLSQIQWLVYTNIPWTHRIILEEDGITIAVKSWNEHKTTVRSYQQTLQGLRITVPKEAQDPR